MRSLVLIAALALISQLSTLNCSAKDLALPTPVDASHYVAGAGAVVAVRLLSIDYEGGVYRYQLLDAAGHAVGDGAVFGLNSTAPDEDTAPAEIRAAIAATLTP